MSGTRIGLSTLPPQVLPHLQAGPMLSSFFPEGLSFLTFQAFPITLPSGREESLEGDLRDASLKEVLLKNELSG